MKRPEPVKRLPDISGHEAWEMNMDYVIKLEKYADWLEERQWMKRTNIQVELIHPNDVEKCLEDGWEFLKKTDLKEK